jgi:hypothetical protein
MAKEHVVQAQSAVKSFLLPSSRKRRHPAPATHGGASIHETTLYVYSHVHVDGALRIARRQGRPQ